MPSPLSSINLTSIDDMPFVDGTIASIRQNPAGVKINVFPLTHLPQPNGPENKKAWWWMSFPNAFSSVWTMGLCPTTSDSFFGRYFSASASLICYSCFREPFFDIQIEGFALFFN